jgi:hypothetical protein
MSLKKHDAHRSTLWKAHVARLCGRRTSLKKHDARRSTLWKALACPCRSLLRSPVACSSCHPQSRHDCVLHVTGLHVGSWRSLLLLPDAAVILTLSCQFPCCHSYRPQSVPGTIFDARRRRPDPNFFDDGEMLGLNSA